MSDLKMPDINHVMLAGRLTRDPELRYTNSGTAICKLGLAVSRFYKGKDGERKEETAFVDVKVWDKAGEYAGNNFRKGRPVYVEGSLEFSSWEDKESGQKRSKLEVRARRVTALDWDDQGGGGGGGSRSSQPDERDNRGGGDSPPDDDIPF